MAAKSLWQGSNGPTLALLVLRGDQYYRMPRFMLGSKKRSSTQDGFGLFGYLAAGIASENRNSTKITQGRFGNIFDRPIIGAHTGPAAAHSDFDGACLAALAGSSGCGFASSNVPPVSREASSKETARTAIVSGQCSNSTTRAKPDR